MDNTRYFWRCHNRFWKYNYMKNVTSITKPQEFDRTFISSLPEVFLGKGALKICSKFASNFIEIALRHGCSPVNLLQYFQNTFSQKHLWVAASVTSFIYWPIRESFTFLSWISETEVSEIYVMYTSCRTFRKLQCCKFSQ